MNNLTAIIDADVIKPDYKDFYNTKHTHKTRIDSKKTKECQLWENMRMRSTNRLKNTQKTYTDIYVCNSWLDFQEFAGWVISQPNWNKVGWELDKDVLSKEKKIYSPETCAFIPKTLNNFFNDYSSRRNLPGHQGVIKTGNIFAMSLLYDGIEVRMYSKDEASLVAEYKKHKKYAAEYMVEKYKSDLDIRIIQALEEFINV